MDSFPLEVSPAALALRLAHYAARSVLRASKYQVEIQKEILIITYLIICIDLFVGIPLQQELCTLCYYC